MENIFDITIVGLGGYGSSIFYQASKQGLKVLGIEQFDSPHNQGSSHGDTRITRQAYYEDPIYVPLAQRSQQMIKDLEKETGQKLYEQIGAVYVGKPEEELIMGVKKSIKEHNLPFELFQDNQSLKKKFPQLNIQPGQELIFEPNAGYLYPEKLIQTYLNLALKNKNAFISQKTKFLGYQEDKQNEFIVVKTDCGNFKTKKLVLSQGMWNSNFLQEIKIPFKIVKQSVAWQEFENNSVLQKEKQPVFMAQYDNEVMIYGFPHIQDGLKAAIHSFGEDFNTFQQGEQINRDFNDILRIKTNVYLEKLFGQKPTKVNKKAVCFYTILPQGDFLIDFHPNNSNVIIVSCCSGHGFKFVPALGKDILQMAYDKTPIHRRFQIKTAYPKF